uniref:CSON002698 protein n=1 Tax=Culicoides sonorensis TaxID=179676 RepID=A0A336MJM1_CULSO
MDLIKISQCSDVKSDLNALKLNEPATFKLTEDCRLLVYGCIEWSAFSTANSTFSLIRNDRVVQKQVVNGQKCVNGERPIDITNSKSTLAMLLGTPKLRFDVLLDENRRICYDFYLNVTKNDVE